MNLDERIAELGLELPPPPPPGGVYHPVVIVDMILPNQIAVEIEAIFAIHQP